MSKKSIKYELSHLERPDLTSDEIEEIKHVFDKFDDDGNGSISI